MLITGYKSSESLHGFQITVNGLVKCLGGGGGGGGGGMREFT